MSGMAEGGPGGAAGRFALPRERFQGLVDLLWERGFRVLGPVIRDGGVVYDEVRRVEELPVGWRETQGPGTYRLERQDDGPVFGVVNGAGSLKAAFFVPEETLLTVRRTRGGLVVHEAVEERAPVAALGVRPCDLAAVAIQDRVFCEGPYADTHYGRRRAGSVTVAVNCTRAAPTCFCVSMGTGPAARDGFDLALTELDGEFLVETGSATGEGIVAALGLAAAPEALVAGARERVAACAASMGRSLETEGLPELLFASLEHPQWDDVARRCLSCGNCTMVCPTCFCHAVVEVPALDNSCSRRVRQWDSCFVLEFAHIAGKNFRPRIRDRYRQWLTHKLGSWVAQFGTSGCVGCGRCIVWCPVGIDITAEVAAIRADRPGGAGC